MSNWQFVDIIGNASFFLSIMYFILMIDYFVHSLRQAITVPEALLNGYVAMLKVNNAQHQKYLASIGQTAVVVAGADNQQAIVVGAPVEVTYIGGGDTSVGKNGAYAPVLTTQPTYELAMVRDE